MDDVIVDLAVYDDGVRREGGLHLDDALEACREKGSFVWIGLHEPTLDEFDAVAEEFHLHELAVQDAIKAHQRPKIEVYDDSLFVVLKTARYLDEREEVTFAELQLFIGPDFVVTVRHGEASALAKVRKTLEKHPERLALGPSAVLHGVVDLVVDDYLPVIAGLDHDLAEIENEVFNQERTNPAERIFKLKGEVLDFQRNTTPLLAALEDLERDRYVCVHPELSEYFRDVRDHLLRVTSSLDQMGALLTDALNANIAQVTVRQNNDMRTISAWVAIGAIPTVFGGVYGMNFEHMPELQWQYSYYVVIGIIATCMFTAWRQFKRSGWL